MFPMYNWMTVSWLLSLLSFTPAGNHTLEKGLVAHYTFNACNARDDTGNGSDGVLFGSVECWCGVEGDGLLLDGVNDYVEFHGKVNRYFTNTNFTVSFYFKPESYQIFPQSMLSKRSDCSDQNLLDLALNLNQRLLDVSVQESTYKYYPGISPAISPQGWQHFALVRDGVRAYTYINGQLRRESYRCSGVDLTNEAPLNFGNSPCIQGGPWRRFKGVIDELRVYDRALDHEEIEELYNLHPIEKADMDCYS